MEYLPSQIYSQFQNLVKKQLFKFNPFGKENDLSYPNILNTWGRDATLVHITSKFLILCDILQPYPSPSKPHISKNNRLKLLLKL